MTTSQSSAPGPSGDAAFLDRVRAATALLEEIVADRALLAGVPPDDRRRLLQAAGHVYAPDAISPPPPGAGHHAPGQGRARSAREEEVLDATGIRTLRRQPVYTTPNVFPPPAFEQREVADDPDFREPVEPQHCYVCKRKYTELHHFYDQLCPECAEFNFAKRTETGRPARPGGAADRRAGQDRLPGGHQAAPRRRPSHRHHPLPPRLGGALRARAGLRRVGPTGWRSSGSTSATRRASRPSATSCWRRATGSTSSSTTPARPCAARPSSTST